MLTVLKSFVTALLGILLGLTLTYEAVTRGVAFGVTTAGPWSVSVKAGSLDADPYLRASQARRGEIPLGLASGLSFVARADSAGALLRTNCDYSVAGAVPSARFWSLSALNPDGFARESSAGRSGFTSAEIVRDAAGDFEIALSRNARAGNWLPLPDSAAFVLMLRLYDTSLSASTSTLDASGMPTIRQVRCR